jgi:hypothetical protein
MADHSRHVAKTFGASVHLAYFDVAEKHICDEMPLFGFVILVYLVTRNSFDSPGHAPF